MGLPADDIERFAREYATTQPSLLRPLIGLEHHRNGAMQFRTLGCLPVLTGAWRHRGGGLARSTHKLQFAVLDMDRVTMPEVHKPGVRVLNMRDLGKDLCDRDLQPPIRSLMVYGANPMVSMPNQSRIRRGAPARRPVHGRARPVRHRDRASTPTTCCPPRARSSIWICRPPGATCISR